MNVNVHREVAPDGIVAVVISQRLPGLDVTVRLDARSALLYALAIEREARAAGATEEAAPTPGLTVVQAIPEGIRPLRPPANGSAS
jgi:hypothetical protein